MKINDNGINRNMTDAEIEQFELWSVVAQSEIAIQAKTLADRQNLKEATLIKLGLTADEVAALLS
jgi:hypothetical protein